MQDLPQIICRSLVFFFIITLAVVNARPSHPSDSTQLISDQDPNQFYDNGIKPWQMELIAQRLAELNQMGDYGFDRSLRSDSERKRRYRPNNCFFNPVSCFKKK